MATGLPKINVGTGTNNGLDDLDSYLKQVRQTNIQDKDVKKVANYIRKSLDSVVKSFDSKTLNLSNVRANQQRLDILRSDTTVLLRNSPDVLDKLLKIFDAVSNINGIFEKKLNQNFNPIKSHFQNNPLKIATIFNVVGLDSPLSMSFGRFLDNKIQHRSDADKRREDLLKKALSSNSDTITPIPPKPTKKVPNKKQPVSSKVRKSRVSNTRNVPASPSTPIVTPTVQPSQNTTNEPEKQETGTNGNEVSAIDQLANIIDNSGKGLNTTLYDILKSEDDKYSPELKYHAAGTLKDLGASDKLVEQYLKKPPANKPVSKKVQSPVSLVPSINVTSDVNNPKLKPEHIVDLFEHQVKILTSMDGSLKKISDKLTSRDEFADEASFENSQEGKYGKNKTLDLVPSASGAVKLGESSGINGKSKELTSSPLTNAVEIGAAEAVTQKVIGGISGGIAGGIARVATGSLVGVGGLIAAASALAVASIYKVIKDADTINERKGYGLSNRRGAEESVVNNGTVVANNFLNPFSQMEKGWSALIHRDWKTLFGGSYDPSQMPDRFKGTPVLSEQSREVEQKRRLDIVRTKPNMEAGALMSTGASLANSTSYNLPELGIMSRQAESNSDAGAVNDKLVENGGDDLGGYSYGLYQFSTKQGTMDNFLDYLHSLADLDPETKMIDDRLQSAGGKLGARQGTDSFKSAWRSLANNKRMIYLQQAYAEDKIYEPVVEDLKAKGLDLTNRSEQLKNAVFELAIGGRGNANKIIDAANTVAGGNLQKLSDADLIKFFYNGLSNLYGGGKEREAEGEFSRGNFRHAYSLYQQAQGERRRFADESQEALYTLQQNPANGQTLLAANDQNVQMKNQTPNSSNGNTVVQQTNNQSVTNTSVGVGLRARQNDSTHQQASQSSYYRN